MEPNIISSQDSFASFKASLATAGLPNEDLQLGSHLLVGYYESENLIG